MTFPPVRAARLPGDQPVHAFADAAGSARSHGDLPLNYAAVGVVLDRLDRIGEDRLARRA